MKRRHIETYLKVAQTFAELSHAERAKVGAIIVKDGCIIAEGYNGTPAGWDNCCEDEHGNTKPTVIHAEQNALDKVTRSHNSSVGAAMFTTHSPCIICAPRIAGSGIKAVYYLNQYRLTEGIEYLKQHGIHVEKVEL